MDCYTKDKTADALTIRNEMMRVMMIGEKALLNSIEAIDFISAEKLVERMNAYKLMFRIVMQTCNAEIEDEEGWLRSAKSIADYPFLTKNEFWESFRDQCVWDKEKKRWITPEYTAEQRLMSSIFDDHCDDCLFWILENGPSCLCKVKDCDPNDCICSRFRKDLEKEDLGDGESTEEEAHAYYERQNERHRSYWKNLGSPEYPQEEVPMARMGNAARERLAEIEKHKKK